ncbi:MAG: hypothetical protein COX62_04675 [Deltaproteobacteria bacterium CG_4_10_14_0_2_um_filter_43_8]|nr:MAG: hypothetical protein COV43_03790 [Deltaproteobacteria bacterium CG11_big_fil_rev_8_21_14_0_20_42_23]PJA20484.1 MAG: hypothetical protein COX62_04675 [Deltaproteobacteria bacterium CG_4_10_14_0_2_um_filter_43_8]PJC63358.1 MAG: hypothetical protein CO021_09760 [Deltaproteobacteria bacterium CG_4_9_14_0_2_um_filter_42_21]
MIDIHSNEALMVWIINRMAELYPKNAILKGGMVLRLLDCPRYTNDLDYVFVPFSSKKEVYPLIKKLLQELPGAKIEAAFHSTSLRVSIQYQQYQTQIEVNVSKACKTEPISTSSLSKQNNQFPHIVSVMSFDVSLSNKLAAWNERGLIRDLYDIYFFHSILKIKPDKETLKVRLKNVHSQRKVKLPKQMTFKEFKERLMDQAKKLTQKDIDDELRDYLLLEERAGLDKKIKIALFQICELL